MRPDLQFWSVHRIKIRLHVGHADCIQGTLPSVEKKKVPGPRENFVLSRTEEFRFRWSLLGNNAKQRQYGIKASNRLQSKSERGTQLTQDSLPWDTECSTPEECQLRLRRSTEKQALQMKRSAVKLWTFCTL